MICIFRSELVNTGFCSIRKRKCHRSAPSWHRWHSKGKGKVVPML